MGILKRFADINKDDTLIAGGKGASLGEMTQAGLPVPPGFVILSEAFDHFLTDTGINAKISVILNTLDSTNAKATEQASEKIQKLILAAPFPPELKKEIERDFANLDAQYVAVRSSATSEDSIDSAWAGQLDSYLNTTEATLLQNIQKCWASLFTPRAIFYRFEKGLGTNSISVAVVVQKMIQSEISGVAFSVHPVTQDTNQLIIEAGFGLGEAIVSGQITPDSYVVTKKPTVIIDKTIAAQERALVQSPSGGNAWIGTPQGDTQKLTDPQILQLSSLVVRIEEHYGFPCDVEWALERGQFFITQSRPITTLVGQTPTPAVDTSGFPKDDLFKWGPIPLKFFYLSDYIHAVSGENAAIQFPKFVLLRNGGRLVWILQKSEFYADGQKQFRRLSNPAVRQTLQEEFQTNVSALEQLFNHWPNLSRMNDTEVATFGENFLNHIHNFWEPSIPFELTKYGGLALLDKEVGKLSVDASTASRIKEVLCAPEEPSFLKQAEMDLDETRDIGSHTKKYFWLKNSYDGVEVLDANYFEGLKKQLRGDSKTKWDAELKQRHDRKAAIIQELKLPNSLVTTAQLLTLSLEFEDRRKAVIFKLQHYKHLFLTEVAARWKTDISKLLQTDLYRIVEALEANEKFMPAPNTSIEAYHCDGHGMLEKLDEAEANRLWNYFEEEQITSNTELSGIVVSTGTSKRPTRGKVRVILRPQDAGQITEPYILVTSMTSPDFIHILKQATGIITDVGGLTSHAAIISRELGIPCIVNTQIATKVLKDGDIVEMDTSIGTIKHIQA